MKGLICLLLLFLNFTAFSHHENMTPDNSKLRVGVVGLVHTHVHWILGREDRGDIEIVGIVEPNRDLAERYMKQYDMSMDLVFNTIEEMVDATKPEAVTAFNSIYDHLSTVKHCAPRGIHVMVEKPLAVSWDHAQKMINLARKHNIHLLTNYETTWYSSHHDANSLVQQGKIGEIRKIFFYTGHPGPIEIGCNPEFTDWLIDPILNGGGALTDFGCYGANLSTWFLNGKKPISVSCITKQIKPDLYPLVDDDATILLNYDDCQVVIQASWNWSHNRKDTEIYGVHGYLHANGQKLNILENEELGEQRMQVSKLPEGKDDPFALLREVVKNNYELPPYDLNSLENNEIVMQILEIAKHASISGEVIEWSSFFSED